MSEKLKVLGRMEELLSRENGWTQGSGCRPRPGYEKEYHASNTPENNFTPAVEATSFCFFGALGFATNEVTGSNSFESVNLFEEIKDDAFDFIGIGGDPFFAGIRIVEWNDAPERKQEDVVGLVRKLRLELEEKARP